MHKKEGEWTQTVASMLGQLLIGAGIALGVSILVLAAASFGISAGWIREALIGQVTMIACAAGAFAGGCVTVKSCYGKRLLLGILVGVLMFGLMLLIGIMFYHVTQVEKEAMILFAACLCGGALSGLIAKKPKTKRKQAGEGRHRKKRR